MGRWNSLALDSGDDPHISYCDWTNEDLEYAYKEPAGPWHFDTVDSHGKLGIGNSIALDSEDEPHISYCDDDNDYLKYACIGRVYDVTIEGHCPVYGPYISVSISMDGSPTGYSTPHTFTGLKGTHYFEVPPVDPCGHPFSIWSTLERSTVVTVPAGAAGTYTAYYGTRYVLTIEIGYTGGGTTDPSPRTLICLEGAQVTVKAIPDPDYVFSAWMLDGSWNESNPIVVTMYSDHTLRAYFKVEGASPAVGGIASPVDKFALLAPYIAFAVVVVAITIGAVYARKRWIMK